MKFLILIFSMLMSVGLFAEDAKTGVDSASDADKPDGCTDVVNSSRNVTGESNTTKQVAPAPEIKPE